MTSRILFWTSAGPDQPSGSPAILAEILTRLPKGSATIVCERKSSKQSRDITIDHTVHRIRFHHIWPFARGSRIRQALRYLGVPLLLLYGLWRVFRFRPQLICTIYYDDVWISSSYFLSRLTEIPIVYYIHDPYLEAAQERGGLAARLARWLEPRSLKHGRVLTISEALSNHYHQRYGITAHVMRNIAPRSVTTTKNRQPPKRHVTIGFSGTIYGNNQALLRQLGNAVRNNSRLHLQLFTNASRDTLAALGLLGEHIEVRFEADYDRLLQGLSSCSLLYLPLAFHPTPGLPLESLSRVLPTKSVDYLLTGAPILVHCPRYFELYRFFEHYRCGYLLDTDNHATLTSWLNRFARGEIEPLDESDIQRAAAAFSPDVNMQTFVETLQGQS